MSYLPNKDIMLEIPAGRTPGASSVNKFGANLLILAGATEDIWDGGGTYSFPTTAVITSISQAADTPTGRNATIEVQGLDSGWNLVIQNVNLDGADSASLVSLPTPLIRVFRAKVLENDVLGQDVKITNAAKTITYAVISAGNNQTLMAVYTVPRGMTAYMVQYWGDTVEATGKEPKSVEFTLWVADRDNSYEFQLKHARGMPKAGSGIHNPFRPYMKVTEMSDIKITASPDTENASIHAGFDLIVETN